MTDLLAMAGGMSVFDIGCNRGHVALDFARYGAAECYGCDNWAPGIETARQNFADLRYIKRHQFEVVDLSEGPNALRAFDVKAYDIVLLLATYHKLKRVMPADNLSELMRFFGRQTLRYFAWRGTSDKPRDNEVEIALLDDDLGKVGMRRIHTSYLSRELGVAAIWAR